MVVVMLMLTVIMVRVVMVAVMVMMVMLTLMPKAMMVMAMSERWESKNYHNHLDHPEQLSLSFHSHSPGHMETLEEDAWYLSRVANLSVDGVPHRNTRNASVFPSTEEYMAQLDAGQVSGLLELYRPDFELFGYSPRDFVAERGHKKASA